MKLKTLLNKTWLPLVKGAGRALALTEGLLVALVFAAILNILDVSPIHAFGGDITSLSLSSDTISMDKPNDGGLVTGSHTVTVNTLLPESYTLTMSSIDTNTDMCQDGKDTGCIKHTDTTIDSPDVLSTGHWGFALPNNPISDKFSSLDDYTNNIATAKFAAVPDINNPVPIRDVDNSMMPSDLETTVVYGVNVGNDQSAGSYSSTIRYTATAKLPPATFGPSTSDYGTDGKVQIDYDEHMIPVKYTGNENKAQWTSLTYQEIADNPKDWYNYPEKQWANAATVKADKLADYQNKSKIINEADVLGYWVYIPRYNYQIQTTTVSNAKLAKDFEIKFHKSTDQKLPEKANTEPAVGDWVTHPAFTWGNKELNGFWMGKFETTGSFVNPTILPIQYPIINDYIGVYYDIAKSIGVNDPANTYGNGTPTTQNTHNLRSATTHMLKNSEWGAVTYLSSSKFGTGVNKVQLNTSNDGETGDFVMTDSLTGCGPKANGDMAAYECAGDITHQYQSIIGQLASTTDNVYGIYDMAGGAYEYVMGNWTDTSDKASSGTTDSSYFASLPTPPYVDLYLNIASNSQCNWLTCGGDALYETSKWDGENAYDLFVDKTNPWFDRGGSVFLSTYKDVGIFTSGRYNGSYAIDARIAFRTALISAT